MSKPTDTTDATFEGDVILSTLPVLVDFWAPWCGPCKVIAPHLDSLAADFEGRLRVVKMDTDTNPNTPVAFGVRGVPSLILFQNGKAVAQLNGAVPKAKLYSWVEGLL